MQLLFDCFDGFVSSHLRRSPITRMRKSTIK